MAEVSVDRDLSKLAPAFVVRVQNVVAELEGLGFDPWVFEGLRTAERQAFLYSKGRTIPGSIVTKAKSHLSSWHGHGLAVDIISRSKLWNAPESFWQALGAACQSRGLTWGGVWTKFPDKPHVQWGECPASPTAEDKARTRDQGMEATWFAYSAVAL